MAGRDATWQFWCVHRLGLEMGQLRCRPTCYRIPAGATTLPLLTASIQILSASSRSSMTVRRVRGSVALAWACRAPTLRSHAHVIARCSLWAAMARLAKRRTDMRYLLSFCEVVLLCLITLWPPLMSGRGHSPRAKSMTRPLTGGTNAAARPLRGAPRSGSDHVHASLSSAELVHTRAG